MDREDVVETKKSTLTGSSDNEDMIDSLKRERDQLQTHRGNLLAKTKKGTSDLPIYILILAFIVGLLLGKFLF